MDRVRIGLIGCGGMGRALCNEANKLERATVVAVSDLDDDRRGQAAGDYGAEQYPDYRDLLARNDVDVVFVATPGGFHRPVVEDAARAGKHIFSEKPLATSVADCDAMIAAVEAAGVKHGVGQVCRFHPTHRRLKQMIAEGPLGPVLSLYVERLGAGWGASSASWRYSYQLSGGTLMEVNAHELDWMLWVAGPAKRVSAVGGRYLDQRSDFNDAMFVSIEFASGAVGVLQSTGVTTLPSYQCRLDCRDGSATVAQFFGGAITYRLRGEEQVATVEPGDMQVETPVLGEVRAFVDSLVEGTQAPVTFYDGRAAVAVAEAAYRAAESGQAVEIA